MKSVVLVGCGFVADLYMAGLARFPGLRIIGAHDRDAARMRAFCRHWNIPELPEMEQAFEMLPRGAAGAGLVLNLTNPASHSAINRAALAAGHHVFCEKPMALDFGEAQALARMARGKGLQLASAPSSVLGEAAQTLARAVRQGVAGTPRLVYAELDDGFIPQAPVQGWISASGAPWPFEDEFRTGCTLEHAGYYLSWLIAMFGPVERVVAASAETLPDKAGVTGGAPDFSVATLFFEDGPPARLTCSIAAPHDHRIRVIGDKGVLQVKEAWDNAAPVKFHRRMTIRRRLLEHPLGRRIRLGQPTHPKLRRSGAAAMNFALGPAEMLDAISEGRESRLAGDFALHLTEVTLAIQEAGRSGARDMTTRCEKPEPMPWAR